MGLNERGNLFDGRLPVHREIPTRKLLRHPWTHHVYAKNLAGGAIGGLLAQGMSPWPAARLGCALLREAGSKAAGEKGPGLLAEDVPVHIAHTLSEWTGSA